MKKRKCFIFVAIWGMQITTTFTLKADGYFLYYWGKRQSILLQVIGEKNHNHHTLLETTHLQNRMATRGYRIKVTKLFRLDLRPTQIHLPCAMNPVKSLRSKAIWLGGRGKILWNGLFCYDVTTIILKTV